MSRVSQTLDRVHAILDGRNLVAKAGLRLPSTLTTLLRSFTLDHVRQLEAVNDIVCQRAWAAGIASAPRITVLASPRSWP